MNLHEYFTMLAVHVALKKWAAFSSHPVESFQSGSLCDKKDGVKQERAIMARSGALTREEAAALGLH